MQDQNNLPNLSREEQQLLMTELNQSITDLEEKKKQMARLSSMNSELKQQLQSALEKNEKLNNSDLQLKEAERRRKHAIDIEVQVSEREEEIKRKIKAAKSRIKEAEEARDRALSQTAKDRAAAAQERREAAKYKEEQKKIKDNELLLIDKAADKKIEAEKARLQEENARAKADTEKRYKQKFIAQESVHYAIYLFCTVWCIIQAVFSVKARADISQIFSWIAKYAVASLGWILSGSNWVASVTNGISNSTVAAILYWIIAILIAVLLAAILWIVVMVGPIYLLYLYFCSDYFDKFNKRFMVVTGVLWIVASASMPELTANLFLIWILLQGLPQIIKLIAHWISQKWSYDKEQVIDHIKAGLIIIGGIFLVIMLTHFLYGWCY